MIVYMLMYMYSIPTEFSVRLNSAEVKLYRLNDFLFSSGLDNINLFKVSLSLLVYIASC